VIVIPTSNSVVYYKTGLLLLIYAGPCLGSMIKQDCHSYLCTVLRKLKTA